MKLKKYISLLLVLFISSPANSFSDSSSTEFFASNNTNEIDLQTAFHRLCGKEQQELQNKTIDIIQKEHLEQGKFENLLGNYKTSDQKLTADNSEKIITSAYQKLSPEKTFKIAEQLAVLLKQESIAVFIPDEEQLIGDTVLKLQSHPYSINETIKLIHDTLPAHYSEAFSLHLNNNICSNFDNAIVDEVEWLGSNIKSEEITQAFPQEKMTVHHGKAYLVYKDGQKEQL